MTEPTALAGMSFHGRGVRCVQERRACRRVSQVPDPTPIDFALFPRAMPAASSGADRPLSVAATVSLRMADMRMVSQAPYRQLRPIRPPCGSRRLRSNPPEQRPSVSAAPSHRRSAQPRSTAMMARSGSPLVVVMSGAFRSAWACRRVSQFAVPTPDAFRALPAGDARGQFRRQPPVVCRFGRQLADGRHDRRRDAVRGARWPQRNAGLKLLKAGQAGLACYQDDTPISFRPRSESTAGAPGSGSSCPGRPRQ